MLCRDAPQSPYDRSLQASGHTLFERPEPVLQKRPARLDGAEIRRVWRQEQQPSSRAFHQGAHLRCVMCAKVVEHDNVARIQPRDEPTADEVDKLRAVHGAIEGLVSQDAVSTHGTHDADVVSPVGRLVIDDALTARRPPIRRRHCDVAARLVDEDQPVRRDGLDLFKEGDALRFDVAAELLRRPEALFFRVTPARRSERSMLERLRSTPWRERQASFSWSSVASGISATSRSSSGNWPSEIWEASASGFRNHVPQLALAPQKPRNGGLANAEALRQLGVRAFVSLIRS
jgi:hypothetical protein